MRYFELTEARAVLDHRHDESDMPYFGAEKYDYIKPEDGFFFHYGDFGKSNGVLELHSAPNNIYSRKVRKFTTDISQMHNALNGKVDFLTKTIAIAKEYAGNGSRQRSITNLKHFKRCLQELKAFGVTDEYKLKGVPSHIPATVGAALKLDDPTDLVFNRNKPIVMYHGTSMKRWKTIAKQGLRPGNTPDNYNDLVPGYSEHNIYLTATPKGAEFYGKRQAKKDKDDAYVILAVTVPDPAKLMADDHMIYRGPDHRPFDRQGHDPANIKHTGRKMGEFAYRGAILPNHLKLLKVGKAPLAENSSMEPKTIYRDVLGIPQPQAMISHFGGSYGKGGYWLLNSTAENIRHRKWQTPEDAEADMTAEGWRVISKDRDGYGAVRIIIEHPPTASYMDRLRARDSDKWENATPCFVRYGKPPADGISHNHRDGIPEAGVSVFYGECLPNGEARALPKHTAELGTLLGLRAKSQPLYIVTGDLIGTGSDGEPLLSNCKIVRRARQG